MFLCTRRSIIKLMAANFDHVFCLKFVLFSSLLATVLVWYGMKTVLKLDVISLYLTMSFFLKISILH